MPTCPSCSSTQTVKNGRIHNGKQRFKYHECGRQFVEQPTKKVIDQVARELIDRLLLERGSRWLALLVPCKFLNNGYKLT